MTKSPIPTLSSIQAGQAAMSDWMLWDRVIDTDDGGPVLCRVVLALNRLTLVQLEKGDLVWIPSGYLLPTEPAAAEEVTGSASSPSASFAPLREDQTETFTITAGFGLPIIPKPH